MNIIMEGLVEKFQSARGFPDNEVSPSGPDTGSDHGQISVRSRSIGLLLMKIYEDFYKKVKKRLWRNGHEPIRSHPNYEIVLYTMHSRFRASPRHGGHGVFLNF